MSTVLHDPMEHAAKQRKEIASFDNEIASVQAELDAAVNSTGGADFKTVAAENPDLANEIAKHGKRLDALRGERMRLSDGLNRTLDRVATGRDSISMLGGGRTLPDGAVLGRAPVPFVDKDGFEALRSAALRKIEYASPVASDPGWLAAADVAWGDPISIDQRTEVPLLPAEFVRLADYIPGLAANAPRVRWFKMLTDASQAGSVAPGAVKNESAPEFVEADADVVKVAHYGRVRDEVFKDAPASRQMLEAVFLRGLLQEENRQIIAADGTGEDMVGLLHTSGRLEVHRATSESRLDTMLRAIGVLRTTGYVDPDVIVMHPSDFVSARQEKASTAGTYLYGEPGEVAPSTLWGFPVVQTTSCTEGYAVVMNAVQAARLYWREQPNFAIHPYGGGLEEWSKNLTLVRAEERFVLAVTQPHFVCVVRGLL